MKCCIFVTAVMARIEGTLFMNRIGRDKLGTAADIFGSLSDRVGLPACAPLQRPGAKLVGAPPPTPLDPPG